MPTRAPTRVRTRPASLRTRDGASVANAGGGFTSWLEQDGAFYLKHALLLEADDEHGDLAAQITDKRDGLVRDLVRSSSQDIVLDADAGCVCCVARAAGCVLRG